MQRTNQDQFSENSDRKILRTYMGATVPKSLKVLKTTGEFIQRHIGPNEEDTKAMLESLQLKSLKELVDKTVPENIRQNSKLDLPEGLSEGDALRRLRAMAQSNQIFKSYIGMGYSPTFVPSVVLRNILENPGWYTQYTPYQAEISQGRLEALLNFQTMITDLTGLDIANASLLDEATAAAEAMSMTFNLQGGSYRRQKGELRTKFFVSELCHPQTIEVLQTRALPLGIEVVVGDHESVDWNENFFAALVQYPATNGSIYDYESFTQYAHSKDVKVIVAADILSLTLIKAPGDFGADVAIGSTQRFGVPMGYGGPHAAYFATKEEFKRNVPGRIVGISKDGAGKLAYRLALQTREQHIRRERATSNICTAQVLLAIMASMYAVYHGPKGLTKIAERVRRFTDVLKLALLELGYNVNSEPTFDTLTVELDKAEGDKLYNLCLEKEINLRQFENGSLGISLHEEVTLNEVNELIELFAQGRDVSFAEELAQKIDGRLMGSIQRTTDFMTHEVFSRYHSETEMMRYMQRLQSRDLSLTTSMISLGSCTMKLNAASEMLPITWPGFSKIHPFAPKEQTPGYFQMMTELASWLSEITGFDATSLQPNAGSQGEYAGLLVIRKYHEDKGEGQRNICLIPSSAHGTNPASAVMAGMKVVVVKCDDKGNVDVDDLKAKAKEHSKNLSALMVTYPSTHGVFEEAITEICEVIHKHGGQVYMDGANMNAQIGLCRPGEFGPDVCHLNLHKTFCIPHGGGGPGVGPICVNSHLTPYLPGHKVVGLNSGSSVTAVSAAPYGSPAILPISWMYIAMMGAEGLTGASEIAILSANYIAKRLETYFPILFKGTNDLVAHECIVDCRDWKDRAGISVEDIAKRLMDYSFHAPTMSWPVAGTLMIEPTESESLSELDRFCDAMISIHGELVEIENGKSDKVTNVLNQAPHTAQAVTSDAWNRPYSREKAAYPLPYLREHKFWPAVGRIDNAFGDKNFVCTCPDISEYDS